MRVQHHYPSSLILWLLCEIVVVVLSLKAEVQQVQYKRLVQSLQHRHPLPVIESIVNGHEELLEQRDDMYGRTPLQYALMNTWDESPLVDVIQFLVHKCPKSLELTDRSQRTALHYACHGRRVPVDCIHLLIESNPKSLEMVERLNQTPLHFACDSSRSVEVIRLLLEAYPKAAEKQDRVGRTPLHIACCRIDEYGRTIQVLTNSCPQATLIQDDDGNTPLHYACSYACHWEKEPQMVQILGFLARRGPVACLLRQGFVPFGSLPLDRAERLPGRSFDVIYCVAQATIEAAYGFIDAVLHLHPSSDVPHDVFSLVEKCISSDTSTMATIKTNGMITNELIDLFTIRELLEKEIIQAKLKDEKFANVIHGFIKRNKSRYRNRKGVKDSADAYLKLIVW